MRKLQDNRFSKHIEKITEIAKAEGWSLYTHNKITVMLSFKKNSERINVYYSKMTVATCVKHPKFGKTQLFRKNITIKQLEEIFKNPRTHTDKGYYTKNGIKAGKEFYLKGGNNA